MRLLNLTLPTPEENLALDEALLEEAEASPAPAEVLRIWESPQLAVVIGRSSRMAEEVDVPFCREQAIPILRRSSGGAAVVIGPGCLMYAAVLSCERRPELRLIPEAHGFVLTALVRSLRPILPGVGCMGTSDLALEQRKFSGNSLRCKRTHLVYHGTLLYAFPLDLLARCLRPPPRQPAYRQGRSHDQFVTNVPATAAALLPALIQAFDARETLTAWPAQTTRQLVAERYSRPEWNLRH